MKGLFLIKLSENQKSVEIGYPELSMADERVPEPLNKRRGVVVKHICFFQQP